MDFATLTSLLALMWCVSSHQDFTVNCYLDHIHEYDEMYSIDFNTYPFEGLKNRLTNNTVADAEQRVARIQDFELIDPAELTPRQARAYRKQLISIVEDIARVSAYYYYAKQEHEIWQLEPDVDYSDSLRWVSFREFCKWSKKELFDEIANDDPHELISWWYDCDDDDDEYYDDDEEEEGYKDNNEAPVPAASADSTTAPSAQPATTTLAHSHE